MKTKAACLLMIAFFTSALFGQPDRVLHFTHTDSFKDFQEIGAMMQLIADLPGLSIDQAAKTMTLHGTADETALAEWLFNQVDKPSVPAPNNRDAAAREYRLQGTGDNTVRIFFLLNTATVRDFQEIATATRTITDLRRAGTYNSARALAVRGTADQIALTAWLIDTLDRPLTDRTAPRDYRMPMSSDPRGEIAVRVLYTSNAPGIGDFQEIAAATRNTADIRRVFTYNAPKAIIMRSTPEQVALGDWLVQQLDKPAAGTPGPLAAHSSNVYKYDAPSDRENMVKVFYIPQAATIQDFQQFATRIRTTAKVRRVFTYNAPRAVAVRGTIDQIQTAERMVQELDTPK